MSKYNGFKKASEWIGKRVVAVRHIETREGKAVTPGMRGTVRGAFGGLDIRFDEWICTACAVKHGGKWPKGHVGAWHVDKCGVCGGTTSVTQPRDWGYPKVSKIRRLILKRVTANEKTKKA